VSSVAAPGGARRAALPLLPLRGREPPSGGGRAPRPPRQAPPPCAYLGDASPAAGSGSRQTGPGPLGPAQLRAQGAPPPAWQVLVSLLAADEGAGTGAAGRAPPAAAAAADAGDAAAAAAAAAAMVAELHAAARRAGGERGARTSAAAASEWASRAELLRPQLGALTPDQLADLAWALSRLGLDPGAGWLGDLMAAAAARFGERRFRGYTFATLLPALGGLGAAPRAAWLAACLRALAGKQGQMWPRELASIAAGLPPLLRALPERDGGARRGAALLAESGWAASFFESSGRQLPRFEPLGLARALHGAAQLAADFGVDPPAAWLAAAAQALAAAAGDGRLGPREVAMSLQALAALARAPCPAARALGTAAARGSGGGSNDSSGEASDEEERSLGGAAAAAVAAAFGGATVGSVVGVGGAGQRTASQEGAHGSAEGQEEEKGDAAAGAALLGLQAALERALAAGAAAAGPEELSTALLAAANLGARKDWLWLHTVLSAAQVGGRAREAALWCCATAPQPALVHGAARPQAGLRAPPHPPPPPGCRSLPRPQAQLQACSPRQLATLLSAAGRLVRACPAAQPRPWDQALVVLQDARRLAAAQQKAALPLGPRGARRAAAAATSAAAHADGGGSTAAAAAGEDEDGGGAAGGGRAFVVRWTQAACAAAGPQLARFSAQDLVATATALASLKVVPPPAWYDSLLRAARARVAGACWAAAGGGSGSGGGGAAGAAGARDAAAALAAALARLSLLPSPGDASVGLQPADAWLQDLFDAAAAAAAAAQGTVAAEEGAPPEADPDAAAAAAGTAVGAGAPAVRDAARLMWAAGALGWCPGDTWWRRAEGTLLAALAAQPGATGAGAGALPPRLAVTLLQAYAAAGRAPPRRLLDAALFAPPARAALVGAGAEEVAGALRALARIAPPPPSLPERAQRSQQTQHQQEPEQEEGAAAALRADAERFVAAAAADLQPRLPLLRARELASLASALAAAGFDPAAPGAPPGWGAALLSASAPLLPACGPPELASLLTAAARLRLRPPAAWLEAALAQLRGGFPSAPPAALSRALAALAAAGYRPSADWTGAFLLTFQRKLPNADAEAIVGVLSALASLQARPGSRWLRPALVTLHPRLHELPPRGLGRLLSALLAMGVRPSHGYLAAVVGGLLDAAAADSGGGRDAGQGGGGGGGGRGGGRGAPVGGPLLVSGLSAAARLGWRPPPELLEPSNPAGLWAATAPRLAGLGDADFARLLRAAAELAGAAAAAGASPRPPQAWRAAARRGLAARAAGMGPRELAQSVWALGRLQIPLSSRFGGHGDGSDDGGDDGGDNGGGGGAAPDAAAAVLARALALRPAWPAPALLQLLSGAARLRLRPGQAWLAALAAAPALARPASLGGRGLVLLAAALAALGYAPPAGWVEAMDTLMTVDPAEGPSMAATREWALRAMRERAVPPLADAAAPAGAVPAAAGGAGSAASAAAAGGRATLLPPPPRRAPREPRA
jgi:hypothetical protein